MKKKIYYEDEHLKIIPLLMVGIGFTIMILLTVLKLKDSNNWSSNGYIVGMVFMFFWTWIAFAFAYHMTIKPRMKFIEERNNILENGKPINGEIIDSKRTPKVYINGEPAICRYFAKVKLECEEGVKTFWTPALLFDPEDLTTNSVTVYEYNDRYYATEFKISKNPINSTKSEKNKYTRDEDTNIFVCLTFIIAGIIFTRFTGWVFIDAADTITRIVIIPFLIASIGVFLRGLVPLLFRNKISWLKNIGTKLYLLGFSTFCFGFLIFWCYSSIKEKNIGMFIFSIPFWIAIIAIIVLQIKALKYR